jgi:hypothetical protein
MLIRTDLEMVITEAQVLATQVVLATGQKRTLSTNQLEKKNELKHSDQTTDT